MKIIASSSSLFFSCLLLALLANTALATQTQAPPQPLSQPEKIASYKIDARLELDEKKRPSKLSGREQLTWRNASPDTITELQFHLYLNAFKNQKSTFFKESGGQLRGDRFQAGEWGWIDVTSLKVANGEDLTGKIKFIHPDDDNADDQTVFTVPLTRPLKPQETIVLDIQFNAQLPRVFARTGYWGQFALVGQWFPKIGVWEEAGERRRLNSGWNCHQFHANTEFYADWGNYDVTLTVPEIFKGKIGATGQQQSEKANADGTVTYQFKQDNVHDFAWTVDAGYVVLKRTFKPAEWIKAEDIQRMSQQLNLPAESFVFHDVECTVLLQPEHLSQANRHFTATFNSLKYFQLWYGNYPYNTITVVDPPFNANGAEGMEYPTFITAGTSWWASEDQNPETVIVHEFGHQYWQGLVASNEFEDSWMDEGFNTYSESKLMQQVYGDNKLPFRLSYFPAWNLPITLPHVYFYRVSTFNGPFDDPIQTAAWRYHDTSSYGTNSYSRTGLMMHTLAAWLGDDTMAKVMHAYARRWRFRHPAPQDFFDTANEISGQDLSWFFRQFVQSTATLDYEIADCDSEQIETAQGMFDQNGQKTEVKPPSGKDKTPATYETVITVKRLEDAWYPHEIIITMNDNSRITAKPFAVNEQSIEYKVTNEKTGEQWNESWPHQNRWHKFTIIGPQQFKLAQLDPDNRVLLEANQVNNSFLEAIAVSSTSRWASGVLFWMQSLLQLVASFA